MQTIDSKANFQQAMSLFAAGVTVITAMHHAKPVGLIATSVCSLSDDPPSVIVCVNKCASSHDAILGAGSFAVNLLSTAHCGLVDTFRKRKGQDRFAANKWSSLETGAPILPDATVALDCEISDRHDGFTHSIIVGVIREIAFNETVDAGCLLWHERGFARSAPLRI
ncbi:MULTISPECIES: flavin reductase family protein [unclassified Paraburkholderia]|uniref:flavin reductase family protein n=1 Tax=unclassified Paraburkholderia TaxID=2615204 RepID=UPI0016173763|nr:MULTISPECIES: flavin reductase family protein [unclassified Paraburkholderia]MBB5411148.1 flavin reductase [Paraburkholderia sp. HC6.4b]MBB5453920.1 flavin reductase [Paraburkholderia sp. Kb1A]